MSGGDVPSAGTHGISDDDDIIRHTTNNAVGAITTPEQLNFTMLIEPDRTARLLEIGVLGTEDQDQVIHAMPARPTYLAMIAPD